MWHYTTENIESWVSNVGGVVDEATGLFSQMEQDQIQAEESHFSLRFTNMNHFSVFFMYQMMMML